MGQFPRGRSAGPRSPKQPTRSGIHPFHSFSISPLQLRLYPHNPGLKPSHRSTPHYSQSLGHRINRVYSIDRHFPDLEEFYTCGLHVGPVYVDPTMGLVNVGPTNEPHHGPMGPMWPPFSL